jgi:hypothetical protein
MIVDYHFLHNPQTGTPVHRWTPFRFSEGSTHLRKIVHFYSITNIESLRRGESK